MASNASTPATSTCFEEVVDMLEDKLVELTDSEKMRHDETVATIEELVDSLEETWILEFHEEDEVSELRSMILTMIHNAANKLLVRSEKTHLENDVCAICLEEKAQDPVYCLQCLKIVSCKGCMVELIQNGKDEHFLKCLRCQRKSPTELPLFDCVNL
ncbi:unnamed protein product [Bursaphelenchus xylophilus]|uniref:(pine wood nematode) hypothetical protein n=1 Tax=Bursaphelenchus xylophilus TaxID=6326 RepID=A0A1I7S838_BURXY|nr:unnamed protein product [Bursaphelenchus xylophilus]CAG9080616.1 unnamed protein product [Bursaphelenchus xylophilus]